MDNRSLKIRLLLVDDEEEFLTASSQALQRRNLDVDIAPNGVSALELIREKQYDVVVMDVKMPDIDGIEVFRTIHDEYPDLPVILLTGHASIDDAFQTSRDGVAEYLSKPIDMDDLAESVSSVVSRWRDRAQDKLAKKQSMAANHDLVRVMLIDDEVEFLNSMRTLLERRNMEVITAENGESGLALLKECLIDVAVVDIKMPGMGGLEVLQKIVRYHPSIQVIILTGHPSLETAMKAIKLGAHEYLEKPPDVASLVETIRRLHVLRQNWLEQQRQQLIDDIRRRYPD